jgi:hypothetical protein
MEANTIARSPKKMEREQLRQLFQLSLAQPWLENRQSELFETMDLCQDVNEQGLICDLLFRFKYVPADSLNECLIQICNKVTNEWDCDPEKTKIAAINRSSYSDSSQHILWLLKPIFADRHGWDTTNFVAKMSDAVPLTGNDNSIVLIDEFSGSGGTLAKAVRWYRQKLLDNGASAKIYVCCLAAMEKGIEKIQEGTDDLFVCHVLKRGISDHYEGEALAAATAIMEKLEGALAPKVGNEILSKYNFGYKKSEALYYFQNGNPVNNVFPIFWWKELKDKTKWRPIFRRI